MPDQRTVDTERAALQNCFPELEWHNYASWTASFPLKDRRCILHVWQQTREQVGYALTTTFPHEQFVNDLIVASSFDEALPVVRAFYDELTRR